MLTCRLQPIIGGTIAVGSDFVEPLQKDIETLTTTVTGKVHNPDRCFLLLNLIIHIFLLFYKKYLKYFIFLENFNEIFFTDNDIIVQTTQRKTPSILSSRPVWRCVDIHPGLCERPTKRMRLICFCTLGMNYYVVTTRLDSVHASDYYSTAYLYTGFRRILNI